jgi:hypothetical protein
LRARNGRIAGVRLAEVLALEDVSGVWWTPNSTPAATDCHTTRSRSTRLGWRRLVVDRAVLQNALNMAVRGDPPRG